MDRIYRNSKSLNLASLACIRVVQILGNINKTTKIIGARTKFSARGAHWFYNAFNELWEVIFVYSKPSLKEAELKITE